jgi:hypothetical protein
MTDTHDINAEINGEAHRRMVEALGTLTLNALQNGARADVTQRALGGMQNSYDALAAEVEKLKAAVERKADTQSLIDDLTVRGYDVVKRAETLEEASPIKETEYIPPSTEDYDAGYKRRKPGVGD